MAATLADLCFLTDDAVLARHVGDELFEWSGHGLALHCVAYSGAADRALGLLDAAAGDGVQAESLLASAERQDLHRGATLWAQRTAEALAVLRRASTSEG